MFFRHTRMLAVILRSPREIIGLLHDILEEIHTMSIALDNLRAAVAQQTSVDQSAVTLIQGLVAEIKAAAGKNDDDAIQALADQLAAAAAPLSQAVTANTPSQPPAAPPPVVAPVAPAPAPLQADTTTDVVPAPTTPATGNVGSGEAVPPNVSSNSNATAPAEPPKAD